MQICKGLVEAVLRRKILDNRQGNLTPILIAMNYFFLCIFQRSTLNLEKKKYLLRKIVSAPHMSNRMYLLQNVFRTLYISKIRT